MPIAYENKCKKRLGKKNSKHKVRHKVLCAALARNKCLTRSGNLKKSTKCHKMNSAVNLSMNRKGM